MTITDRIRYQAFRIRAAFRSADQRTAAAVSLARETADAYRVVASLRAIAQDIADAPRIPRYVTAAGY